MVSTGSRISSRQRALWGGIRSIKHVIASRLYLTIRHVIGLTQEQVADRIGIQRPLYARRELYQSRYTVAEIVVLWEVSGLSARDYMRLLTDLAVASTPELADALKDNKGLDELTDK